MSVSVFLLSQILIYNVLVQWWPICPHPITPSTSQLIYVLSLFEQVSKPLLFGEASKVVCMITIELKINRSDNVLIWVNPLL